MSRKLQKAKKSLIGREMTLCGSLTPDNVEDCWNEFEQWADGEGLGDEFLDWFLYWECWADAYIAGIRKAKESK